MTNKKIRRILSTIGGLLFFFFFILSNYSQLQAQTKFELEGNMLKLPKPIIFETGTDKIIFEESEESLKHVKEYLTAKKYITVMRIEIHAQRAGDQEKLQTLTENRALAIANWLVENGVDCKRILPVGFGSTKPIVDPTSGPEANQNNRVEFQNAELAGHPIGGLPLDGGGTVVDGFCKTPNPNNE